MKAEGGGSQPPLLPLFRGAKRLSMTDERETRTAGYFVASRGAAFFTYVSIQLTIS